MLPVSLQVLEAGDGGGGMSILSAFSLFDVLFPGKLAKKKWVRKYAIISVGKKYNQSKSERLIDNIIKNQWLALNIM